MKTIVMGGGYGQRMGYIPKMFMRLNGRTLLEYALDGVETDIVFVTREDLVNDSIPILDNHGFDYEIVNRKDSFRKSLSEASKLCGNEFFVVCSHEPIEREHLKRMSGLGLTGYSHSFNQDMINLNSVFAHMPYRLDKSIIERMIDDNFRFTVEHYISQDIDRFGVYETRFLPEVDYREDFERLQRFMSGLK